MIITVSAASILYTNVPRKNKGIKIVFKSVNDKYLVTGARGSAKTSGKVEVQVEAIYLQDQTIWKQYS